MKRIVMQLMRTIVTVIVMGTMAAMIFSLRSELAEAKRLRGKEAAREMGVMEAIMTRGSCRQFEATKPISDEAIEKILRCAMSAPTAMDKRPWEFVVVRDQAKLAALGERLPNCRVGNGAQVAIIVCGTLDNGLPGRGKEYWIHDCSAASMNILLAAHSLGIGAVWTGVYPGEERMAVVREIVGVPDGYAPLNIIPLGYPKEAIQPKDKWNPSKIHKDQW